MKAQPMGILLMMLAGWLNRHQQDVIEYLKEENKILREKLGTKRILLNDHQRMRLARLGKRLGRKVLADACSLFSPDTSSDGTVAWWLASMTAVRRVRQVGGGSQQSWRS